MYAAEDAEEEAEPVDDCDMADIVDEAEVEEEEEEQDFAGINKVTGYICASIRGVRFRACDTVAGTLSLLLCFVFLGFVCGSVLE